MAETYFSAFCRWCEASIPVGRRDYCCPECRDAANGDLPETDGECDWCGSPTDGPSRFCSRSCARAAESDHA